MGEQFFLGIDPGQTNLGVAVLCWDGDALAPVHTSCFQASSGYDFIRNADITAYLRHLQTQFQLTAAALESPAYSARFKMVSIGSLHGVLTQTLVDAALPFLYVTPNKLKFFAAGPAKGGAHSKSVIVNAVRTAFGLGPGELNDNIADALVLATMAWSAHLQGFTALHNTFLTPWGRPWAHEVFLGTQKASKGKPAGILHRPNEFFYLPPAPKP